MLQKSQVSGIGIPQMWLSGFQGLAIFDDDLQLLLCVHVVFRRGIGRFCQEKSWNFTTDIEPNHQVGFNAHIICE